MRVVACAISLLLTVSAFAHTADDRLKVQLRKEETAAVTGVVYSLWRHSQYPVLLPKFCFVKGMPFETVADEVIDATRHLIEHEPSRRDDLLQTAFIMTYEVWRCPPHPTLQEGSK